MSSEYCRWCGFKIRREEMWVGGWGRGRWVEVWVHDRNGERSCMWSAEPKHHTTPKERTLYEQITDARARVRELEREIKHLKHEQGLAR